MHIKKNIDDDDLLEKKYGYCLENRSKERKRSLSNAIIVFGPQKLDSKLNSLYVKYKKNKPEYSDRLYVDKKWIRENFVKQT